MHIHFSLFIPYLHHARWIIHSVRHARLAGWSMRFIGTMLLMLLFSVLQGVVEMPAPALAAEESRSFSGSLYRDDGPSCLQAESATDAHRRSLRADRTGSLSPHALPAVAHTGVFYRLQPGIYLIPRKDRLPKPKSVYRISARAPGVNSVSPNEGFHHAAS